MKQNINGHSIANTARMTRSLHKGAFLLTEGDTDTRVYKRFLQKKKCRIIPAHGKENALQALDILEKENFKGLLAVVDADFWHLEKFLPGSGNLKLTDSHDLETMILSCPHVQEKILDEFGHTNKIQTHKTPFTILI